MTDKSGHPVRGLKREDFTILDNRQPRAIAAFQAVEGVAAEPDPPVEVILVVDEINTPFARVAFERNEIEKYLRRNGGVLERPVSIAFFTDAGLDVGNPPSRDGSAVIADLNRGPAGLRVLGRSLGLAAAADHLEASLRALDTLAGFEAARPGRKLVIWISPGWAYASGSGAILTSPARQKLFDAHAALSDGLRQAHIALYNVDPFGTSDAGSAQTDYSEFARPLRKPGQAEIGYMALQALASSTGGRVLNSYNDLAGEIATCVADLDAFYVLSFDGTAAAGANEYHAIEVRTGKRGLAVHTLSGYYAQREQTEL